MADMTVDSLQIEIEANSSKAAEQVNKLSAALERLKQSIAGSALSSAAKQIKQLGTTAKKSTPSQRKEAVSKATKSVDALKATKELEKLDAQIAKTEDKISELKNRFNALVEIESSYPQGFGKREQNEIDKISQALSDLRTQYSALKQQRDETFGRIKRSVFPKIETPKEEFNAANVKPMEPAIDNARVFVEVDDSSANAVDDLTERVSALHDAIKAVNAEKINLDIPKTTAQVAIEQTDIKSPAVELASSGEVSQATEKINELKNELGNTTQAAKKAAGESSRLKKALSDLGKSAVSSAASGLKKLGAYISSKFTAPFKNAIGVINKVKSAFGRIMFYRAIRSAIQMVTNGLKEGINNLYQYSTIVGTQFAPAMNKLATASQYLKNSFGAMTAPLIEALAPAIDFIIDKFVALLNVVNRVFAALTGKSTYTVAKKQAKDYADAASGAAKATQKFLLGIDELNILNEDSGGGGAGADYGSMFEEMEIDSDTLDLVKQIRDAIENGDWRGAGAALAEKLNGLLESWDSYSWGYSLGQKITNGLNLIYGFMTTFNWELLGSKVADGLNGLMDGVDWDLLGRVFARKWNALVDFIYGFVTTFHWADLGKNISDAVNGWFDEINWEKAAKTINEAFSGILTTLRTTVQKIYWKQIGNDIYTYLANIDWAGIMRNVAGLIGEALGAAILLIWGFIETPWKQVVDWWTSKMEENGGDIIGGLLDGIVAAVTGIYNWVKTNIVYPFVNAFCDMLGIHSPSTLFFEFGENIVKGLFNGISGAWSSITGFFGNALEDLISLIGSAWETIATVTTAIWSGIFSVLSGNWGNIKAAAIETWETLKTTIGTAWENIKQSTSQAWENIKSALGTAWESLKQAASEKFENIRQSISAAWENVRATTIEKWEGIKSTLSETWSNIKQSAADRFNEIKNSITNIWTGLASAALTWGSDIVRNIANGIRGAISLVVSAAKDVANAIKDFLGFSEPEKGPLSNFHTYMPDMLQLMAKGIRDNTDLAVNAASDLAGEVKNAFSDIAYDASNVNLPTIPDMEANYAVATSYSAANNAGSSGGYSDATKQSNEEMISVIYAVGQQIITAIQEKGGDVYLDGAKVGSMVTQRQNRSNRMYGKTQQNT